MRDIQKRDDIYLIINHFYKDIMEDNVIGHFFNEVVDLSDPNVLESHLQVITNFWATILLDDMSYNSNAMRPHMQMNRQSPMEKKHFDRWLVHLNFHVDQNFEGEKAHLMKTRALSIATVMQIKMHGHK